MHKKYAEQNTARMEKILKSSAQTGLTEQEAQRRLQKDGKNAVLAPSKNAVASTLGGVLKNGTLPFFALILLLCASALGKDILLPLGIYLFFLVAFLLLSHRRRQWSLAHQRATLPLVKVLREGKHLHLSPEDLAVGDLLELAAGDVLYTYAHILSDEPITAFCKREGKGELFLKHGGDCFDETDEPFNSLRPGDVVREGRARAFVYALTPTPVSLEKPQAQTVDNHGKMCSLASRICFVFVFLMLAVAFLRACLSSDTTLLCDTLLLSGSLLATASVVFHPVLFDLLFFIRNKKNKAEHGGSFASVADAELLTEADSFVLSSRSMFRSAQYVTKHFETASGKRISDQKRTTVELSLIADALCATEKKCELSLREQALYGFSVTRTTVRSLTLYAKATTDDYTHASFHGTADGKPVSLVWGKADALISELSYFSEDGKTRLLDAGSKRDMLEGVERLSTHGYSVLAFAETQVRNTPGGIVASFPDLKLLGFFALRKASDEQAERTLLSLKEEGKKVFFIHDGESADWLRQEIRLLSGVPVLDGRAESFRDELGCFVSDEELSFAIGTHLTSLQRAQVVQALEGRGYRVVAYGESFEDHRMMCAATAAMAPLKKKENAAPIVMRKASLHCEEHISAQVDSVQSASKMLGGFGVLTAFLCASLLGRSVLAFLGVCFGVGLLPVAYYMIAGIVFDLLAFWCYANSSPKENYGGWKTLLHENIENASLFVGLVFGSLVTGILAVVMQMNASHFAFDLEAFVLFSLLLLMNVGMWRFSSARHSASTLLFPFVSVSLLSLAFLAHLWSGGVFGFSMRPEMFFWALFPTAALLATGIGTQAYLNYKNKDHQSDEKEKL
ncbi:MAG: hypothetical protein IJV96_05205 [Clostridia bacterium]|nr:hypothetical protein [Clostridia bacterium]